MASVHRPLPTPQHAPRKKGCKGFHVYYLGDHPKAGKCMAQDSNYFKVHSTGRMASGMCKLPKYAPRKQEGRWRIALP